MAKLYNRVAVATGTTGTGTVTLGAALSAAFCTFAEAGVQNGDEVTYLITEGNDFELGRGTYTSSGTTLSRTTVLLSKIGGTAGTTKMNLAGAANVRIAIAAQDVQSDVAITGGSISGVSGVALLSSANVFSAASQELLYTDAGAASGPELSLYRLSASPAVSDILGRISLYGRDNAGNKTTYAAIEGLINQPGDTGEEGIVSVETIRSAVSAWRLRIGGGVYGELTTGGDQGEGTANFGEIYEDGVSLSAKYQAASATLDALVGLLQLVFATTSTPVTVQTTTWTDSGITASITPKFSNSKILVVIQAAIAIQRSTNTVNVGLRLVRGTSTVIWDPSIADNTGPYGLALNIGGATNVAMYSFVPIIYIDSPGVTSSVSYKLQGRGYSSSDNLYFQPSDTNSNGKSSITLVEIGG